MFVYLSLFCEVRYCIARHLGFLVGLGRPAGDPQCLPQTVDEVLPLLRGDLPFKSDLDQHLALCEGLGMGSFPPQPDSAQERAIFACAAHVFLRTSDASRALHALKCVFDGKLEYIKLLLAFIRTAHYWTEIHPELVLEETSISSWLPTKPSQRVSLQTRPNCRKTSLLVASQKI